MSLRSQPRMDFGCGTAALCALCGLINRLIWPQQIFFFFLLRWKKEPDFSTWKWARGSPIVQNHGRRLCL